MTMRSVPLSSTLALATVALLGGCSNEGEPLNPSGPESIARRSAPASAATYTAKVNRYRAETFGMEMDVQHASELYTAAYRHAVNLNTANSGGSAGASGSGVAGDAIGDTSTLAGLEAEFPTTGIYPALFTSSSTRGRVEAVVGGPDLLRLTAPAQIWEDYVFSGAISRQDGTWNGQFRGFNQDVLRDANGTLYQFDPVDNLWYSRHGRTMLMRPSVRYIGYANARDGGIAPPYPILGNRFQGVMMVVGSNPLVGQLGHWPSHNHRDVIPYGLDTDVGGPNQFAGPPIHISLPVAEPILTYPDSAFYLEFQKMEFDPETGAQQVAPVATTQRRYRVYTNTEGLSYGGISTGLNANYVYSGAGSAVPVVSAGKVTSVVPSFKVPSATSTNTLTPVPTGYSVITFDATVDLTQVVRGDQVQLTIEDSGSYPFPGQYSGSYTVIWNSAVPAAGIPSLPANSLAVSYINGEALTASGINPINIFNPNGNNVGMANPLPAFNSPVDEDGNVADIVSVSRARFAAVVDNDANRINPMRDGELFIVPTEPLEPSSWYEVRLRLRTGSYVLEDASNLTSNPNRLYTFRFKTNAKIPALY